LPCRRDDGELSLESPAHFKLTSKGGRQKEKPVLFNVRRSTFTVRGSPAGRGSGFGVQSSKFRGFRAYGYTPIRGHADTPTRRHATCFHLALAVSPGLEQLTKVSERSADLQKSNDPLLAEIGERKRAEEKLARLNQTLQTHNIASVRKDLELRYILVNREYERRDGVQREQIRGKTDFDIHSREVVHTFREHDRQVIAAGLPIQFEEAVPASLCALEVLSSPAAQGRS
jgi:PAS domain-containing protein